MSKDYGSHKFCKCGSDDCYPCRHELQYCLVCRGGESEIPTDCPGMEMTEDKRDLVRERKADFRKGRWVRFAIRRKR